MGVRIPSRRDWRTLKKDNEEENDRNDCYNTDGNVEYNFVDFGDDDPEEEDSNADFDGAYC